MSSKRKEEIDVLDVIKKAVALSHTQLEKERLKKREQFHEIIHAAFILNTSASFYLTRPQPTESDLSWVASAYPNSTISRGSDQGAKYCDITPKL